MAKDIGYTPAKAGPGKDNYNTTGGGKTGGGETNAHRGTKKQQEGGKVEDTKVAARAHLWNADGQVNPDPEQGTSKGKSL